MRHDLDPRLRNLAERSDAQGGRGAWPRDDRGADGRGASRVLRGRHDRNDAAPPLDGLTLAQDSVISSSCSSWLGPVPDSQLPFSVPSRRSWPPLSLPPCCSPSRSSNWSACSLTW